MAGTQAAGAATAHVRAAWSGVRGDSDIQYAPLPPYQQPETPGWLLALGRFLERIFGPLGRALGLSWPVLERVLIALAALALALVVWRLVALWLRRRSAAVAAAEDPEWAPSAQEAGLLLADADRLAAAGRYDEAAHLLLRRSVEQIAQARPDWLHPASTAREIAALPRLPERARAAFTVIARRVEASRFALRPLRPEDWQAARAAYADFALQRLAATEAGA